MDRIDLTDTSKTSTMEPHDASQFDWYSPLYDSSSHNKNQLDILKKEGIIPKTGKWDDSEVSQLEKNMQEYLEQNSVKDFSRLIDPQTKDEIAFRKKTLFLLRMCKGLHRTYNSISRKVDCHFGTFYNRGYYSKEEKIKLLQLYEVYGRHWKKIGTEMNRSRFWMGSIYSTLISNRGPWTKEEDDTLIKAVNNYVKKREKVSWTAVSHCVGTRSKYYCQDRWLKKFRNIHNIDQSESIDFNDKDIFKIVTLIYKSNVDDQYLIDWEDLSHHFDDSVSPIWLKGKFGAVCKQIPNSHLLDFEELIDQLFAHYSEKVDKEESISNFGNGDSDDALIIEQNRKPTIDDDLDDHHISELIIIED